MKRYLMSMLIAISVLTSGLLAGCAQETQPDTELQEFRSRLVESHQIKLRLLEQINEELGNLQEEISMIESELAEPLPMRALHNMTSEEIAKSIRRPGLETKLTELKVQEQVLLSKKRALEHEIEELEQLLRQD